MICFVFIHSPEEIVLNKIKTLENQVRTIRNHGNYFWNDKLNRFCWSFFFTKIRCFNIWNVQRIELKKLLGMILKCWTDHVMIQNYFLYFIREHLNFFILMFYSYFFHYFRTSKRGSLCANPWIDSSSIYSTKSKENLVFSNPRKQLNNTFKVFSSIVINNLLIVDGDNHQKSANILLITLTPP